MEGLYNSEILRSSSMARVDSELLRRRRTACLYLQLRGRDVEKEA